MSRSEAHMRVLFLLVLTQNTIKPMNMHLVLYCILTFGLDADIDVLKHRLYDYNQLKLGEGQYISDWESELLMIRCNQYILPAQAMATAYV